MNELLDKPQVAKILNVSIRSVDRLRQTGDLRAVIVGNRIRFHPQDIAAFIAAHIEPRVRV